MSEPVKKTNQNQSPESYSPEKPKLVNMVEELNGHKVEIIKTIDINGAVFEVIRKPRTIYAGVIGYADEIGPEPEIDMLSGKMFWDNVESPVRKNPIDRIIAGKISPTWEVVVSINYWKGNEAKKGMMFAREVNTTEQPDGVYVHEQAETLYIRCQCNVESAKLLGREHCAPYELFGYIREKVASEHGYEFDRAWQEIEYIEYNSTDVFYIEEDSPRNHDIINMYSYIPVVPKEK
ncbi:MAG: hypothetical protein FWD71_19130 [Oscillospiraceae bacterium]|nr:hypothetical protein [Oscillospiraceae bacterium]